MKKLFAALLLCLLPSLSHAYLCYEPGDVVPYNANFHDDTGTLTDPTSPAAKLIITQFDGTETFCDDAGGSACSGATNGTLDTPAKQDSTTGFYGGQYTIGSTANPGIYQIRVSGTVPTSKNVAKMVSEFQVRTSCPVERLEVATEGFAKCDVTAAADGENFQVGSCTDWQDNSIALATGFWELWGMVFYTNGGSACNVASQGIQVQDTTLNGSNLDVAVATDNQGRGGATAAPSVTNCGVLIVK